MISGRPCRARASLNLTASEKNFLVCRHWHHLPVVLRRCHLWRGLSSLLSLDSSQNYSSPLNACIDRAACGSCARFYTDSYTAGPDRGILARLSSPRSVPFARPYSLFPAFPASLTSLDTPCFPLPQREPSRSESPVVMVSIEHASIFSHDFPHEMALYGEGRKKSVHGSDQHLNARNNSER